MMQEKNISSEKYMKKHPGEFFSTWEGCMSLKSDIYQSRQTATSSRTKWGELMYNFEINQEIN